MRLLTTHATNWDPKSVRVTLNVCTEACIVPSDEESARLSYGHVVVLDGFITEEMRKELFELVNQPGWRESQDPQNEKWQRATCDTDKAMPTWGLKDAVLKEMFENPSRAMKEVHSRLAKLYPEVDIYHMPSDQIQSSVAEGGDQSVSRDEQGRAYDCDNFVANAAVCGDCFQWHVDADPWTFAEDCTWARQHGIYFNGEPGKPLFVSLLIYLNSEWEREWDAETLFLDSHTETGFFIRPASGRAVLMDQDVLHRLSAPSRLAERPRYSLVWKLVFIPKKSKRSLQIARREWGPPTFFGSAATAKAVQDSIF